MKNGKQHQSRKGNYTMQMLDWTDTLRSRGNPYDKPILLQMLSKNGWLLQKKVAGVLTSVRYGKDYVITKVFKEIVEPYAATTLSDDEVFDAIISLVAEAMKLRNPEFVPSSPLPQQPQASGQVTQEQAPPVIEAVEIVASKKR